MAVRIRVKNVKPYKEISPKIDGRKINNLKFGCKLYDATELEEIQEQYQNILENSTLDIIFAKLDQLEETGDKTSEDFYNQRSDYREQINRYTKERNQKVTQFCKDQILFILGASMEIEMDEGVKDITVQDTRTVSPVESLWNTSEECLDVLLDAYLENISVRDSLISEILSAALNINLEGQLKN